MEYKGSKYRNIEVETHPRDLELYRMCSKGFNINIKRKEALENAKMIQDAFLVSNQTGLLPSTILKQRDEAVEMLKRCENWVRSCNQHVSIGNDIESLLKSITESK